MIINIKNKVNQRCKSLDHSLVKLYWHFMVSKIVSSSFLSYKNLKEVHCTVFQSFFFFFYHFMNHIKPKHNRDLYSEAVRCWQWTTMLPDPDSIIQCFFFYYLLYMEFFYHPYLIQPEKAVKSAAFVVLVSYQHGWS